MRYLRSVAALAAMVTAMLLQAGLIAPLSAPDPVSLPTVLVAAVALVDGPGAGMSFGFAAGLLADLGSAHPAGVLALTWTGLGLVCGVAAARRTTRGYAVTAAACGAVATSIATLLLAVVHAAGASVWLAARDLIPATIGDTVLALAVVPLVRAVLRTEALRAPRPVLTELNVARRG
jgi:cell shape-determining protein MreD